MTHNTAFGIEVILTEAHIAKTIDNLWGGAMSKLVLSKSMLYVGFLSGSTVTAEC